MSVKISGSFFDLHKTNMLGDHIVSGEDGYLSYKITILEDKKLDNALW